MDNLKNCDYKLVTDLPNGVKPVRKDDLAFEVVIRKIEHRARGWSSVFTQGHGSFLVETASLTKANGQEIARHDLLEIAVIKPGMAIAAIDPEYAFLYHTPVVVVVGSISSTNQEKQTLANKVANSVSLSTFSFAPVMETNEEEESEVEESEVEEEQQEEAVEE